MIAYNSTLTPAQVTNLYNYYNAIALPIHWGSFTEQVNAGNVYLTWTTENTSTATRFIIERSMAGSAFANIGQVPAAAPIPATDPIPATGGSNNTTYHFTDNHPSSGDNIYRIQGIDADGTSSWTSILEFFVPDAAPAGIRLQENPVAGNLGLINNGGILINRLQVLDIAGRVLLDQAPNSSNSLLALETSGLKAGYYFLRIGTPGNTVTIAFLKL